jgi:hypothetical protein
MRAWRMQGKVDSIAVQCDANPMGANYADARLSYAMDPRLAVDLFDCPPGSSPGMASPYVMYNLPMSP